MTVEELLHRMSSRELSEWMALYKLEPFGAEADFLGHAITAHTTYSVNRGKNSKKLDVKDFVPDFEKQAKPHSIDDLISKVETMNMMFGGKDER
jgi:hypothetical protein